MIKKLKSNKIISAFLIIMCIIILFNPTIYAKACLNAISVWAVNVLPLLFPFFVLTRLIVSLNKPKANFMEKFFSKIYHTPIGSFNTFFLSVLSGYPMGAKLICSMHENGQASNKDAEKMLSFCSVSGPMFMLGTVGIMMLSSYKAGLIILISNILAGLINGLIYRKEFEPCKSPNITIKKQENVLSESVYDSLVSILMVGAYIVLSFLIIEFMNTLKIFDFFTHTICGVLNINNCQYVVKSILIGLIEITGGILSLSSTHISLSVKTIISSGLIGFGGISILLQSVNFLSNLKIPIKRILVQKITQSILCIITSIILCLIFL